MTAPPITAPLCVDCTHFTKDRRCLRAAMKIDLTNGKALFRSAFETRERGMCGQEGNLFEPKPGKLIEPGMRRMTWVERVTLVAAYCGLMFMAILFVAGLIALFLNQLSWTLVAGAAVVTVTIAVWDFSHNDWTTEINP